MDKRNPPTAPHPPHPHPTPRAHPPCPPPPLLPLSPPPPQRAPATVNVRTQDALEVLAVCKHLISHTASTRSRRRGVGEGAPAARAVLAPSTRVDRPSTRVDGRRRPRRRPSVRDFQQNRSDPRAPPAPFVVQALPRPSASASCGAGRPCTRSAIDPIRGRGTTKDTGTGGASRARGRLPPVSESFAAPRDAGRRCTERAQPRDSVPQLRNSIT